LLVYTSISFIYYNFLLSFGIVSYDT